MLAQSGGGTTHKDGKSRKEEEMEEEKKEHKRHVSLKRTKYDKGDRDGRHPSLAEGGGKHDRLKRKGRHKTKSGQAKLRSDGSSLRHAQGEEGDEEKNASRLEERPWIAANLKTRLVDRSFQKGKFYNQKASSNAACHKGYIDECVYSCTCVCACMCAACVRACVHVCVRACVHACLYVCLCVFTLYHTTLLL